jgi:hypothetical protein
MQLVVVLGVALVSLFSNTTSLPGHQNRYIESLMQTAPVSICRERRGGLVGEDDLFMNQPLTPFVDDRAHDLPGGRSPVHVHTSIPAYQQRFGQPQRASYSRRCSSPQLQGGRGRPG